MIEPASHPLEHVVCHICKSDDGRVLDKRMSEGQSVRNVQCQRCGLVYLDPRAGKDEYQGYYQRGFTSEFNKLTNVDGRVLAAGAQPKADRILEFLEPELRPGMRVLEIGCGFGNILARLRDGHAAAEVVGIEPDPQAVQVAEEVFGLRIQNVDLGTFAAAYGGSGFDLIVMHHVLEHFLDLDQAGAALSRLLARGGRIYVGVPNGAWPAYRKSMFFRFPHTVTFTPYTLALFLWQHGFKVIDSDKRRSPMAVIAAWREEEIPAQGWSPIVKASLPPRRLRWLSGLNDVWRIVQSRLKVTVRAMFPTSFKRSVRKALNNAGYGKR